MKSLNDKIDVIKASDDNYLYLTAAELAALLKMRKVKHFALTTGIDRYKEINGNSYYPGHEVIEVTRKQAVKSCDYFINNKPEGFARVYFSDLKLQADPQYYVSL